MGVVDERGSEQECWFDAYRKGRIHLRLVLPHRCVQTGQQLVALGNPNGSRGWMLLPDAAAIKPSDTNSAGDTDLMAADIRSLVQLT